MPPAELAAAGTFHAAMDAARRSGTLVVQPRMGFGDTARMRAGLIATRDANAATVGTLTLDSFTRVGDFDAAARAVREGRPLNGYPIVSFAPDVTRTMLDGVCGPDFPVQVRHGSPLPGRIFDALIDAGIDATEGGPISYCLPYSRTPVQRSVAAWKEACRKLAALRERGVEPHLESFGGCMLGQLCPPSLLIAITVLEGLFFLQNGVRSISLSYAQQTSAQQDEEAVTALHRIAARLMPDAAWHVVIYAYMGLYPATEPGALRLVADAARLAVRTGSTRLIVKTAAEAERIPSIAENVTAMEVAAAAAAMTSRGTAPAPTGVEAEALALIHAVLDLNGDVGKALVQAFAQGYLDIPYCMHPDNAGRTRSVISDDGRLEWTRTGSLPIGHLTQPHRSAQLTSTRLLHALSYVKHRYDDLPTPA
ncbi:methylaspartate mutase [Streptomyces sp. SL13]|uniref:Methylaspartate mutase n=1 Tax=Streptantibioticus silvisoli TaxID=2705255 RepID=A0AA90H5B7_9ACTN|nr:methylaspartate mutase [Streptantibioticus silvisoli]MDI5962222.1 methylaspartate mutase [Streptantibioticus silvisoli]MDI5970652.1 methylaspartate mutase [Streptantibioticus silvisoli]